MKDTMIIVIGFLVMSGILFLAAAYIPEPVTTINYDHVLLLGE